MKSPLLEKIEARSRAIIATQRCGAVWCDSTIRFPDGTTYERTETDGTWKFSLGSREEVIDKVESVVYLQIRLLRFHTETLTNEIQ